MDSEDLPGPVRRAWGGWHPLAASFHYGTLDVPFQPPNPDSLQITWRPKSEPLKAVDGETIVELPPFDRDSEFSRALLGRRTWRRFGSDPLAWSQLSDLLGLTWGVQGWLQNAEGHELPLKTSPSGGCRHSLEAYVVVRDVDGLEPGTYHYDPDEHALSHLHAGAPTAEQMEAFLPTQHWFHNAAAVVFMTSVLPRVWWRYEHPRAYRVILHEAGHFAQTFCLLATEQGLAPFCTAALGDSAIEEHLGVDGIEEVVLYAVGVGSRPEGLDWAPDPDRHLSPPTSPPAHEKRRDTGG